MLVLCEPGTSLYLSCVLANYFSQWKLLCWCYTDEKEEKFFGLLDSKISKFNLKMP